MEIKITNTMKKYRKHAAKNAKKNKTEAGTTYSLFLQLELFITTCYYFRNDNEKYHNIRRYFDKIANRSSGINAQGLP